jgi:hypothetical protein
MMDEKANPYLKISICCSENKLIPLHNERVLTQATSTGGWLVPLILSEIPSRGLLVS